MNGTRVVSHCLRVGWHVRMYRVIWATARAHTYVYIYTYTHTHEHSLMNFGSLTELVVVLERRVQYDEHEEPQDSHDEHARPFLSRTHVC